MKVIVVIAAASAGCWAVAQQPQWRYRELPTIPGLELSATGINESGQMAIQVYRPSDFARGVGRFTVAGGYVLQELDPSKPCGAGGITRNGNIYGLAVPQPSMVAVISWNPISGLTQYSPPWSTFQQFGPWTGVGCSDDGIVLSNLELEYGLGIATRVHYPDHSEGVMDGNNSAAEMNASGLFVGQWLGTHVYSGTVPYVSDPRARTVTTLNSPGQLYGGAHAINDSGQIFGIVSKQGSAPGWYGTWWNYAGAVLRQVKLYDIGHTERTDPHNSGGSSVELNENGEVTYNFYPDTSGILRPKFYSPLTGEIDIRDNVIGLPSGKRLTFITGLTNSRYMTGYLQDQFGAYRNFYLEPVPEPATLTALGVGAVALLRRRKAQRH